MNISDKIKEMELLRHILSFISSRTEKIDQKILVVSTGGSPDELSEELVTQEKQKKGWRMNCDVGEATEGLENEL